MSLRWLDAAAPGAVLMDGDCRLNGDGAKRVLT